MERKISLQAIFMLNIKPSLYEYTTKPKILVCQNDYAYIDIERFNKSLTDFSFQAANLNDCNSTEYWLQKDKSKFDLIWHTDISKNDFDYDLKNLLVTVHNTPNNELYKKYPNIVCSNSLSYNFFKQKNISNLSLINDFIDLTLFGHDKNFKSREFKILIIVKEETEYILNFLSDLAKPLHNLELKTIRFQDNYKPAVRNSLYNECKIALVLSNEEDLVRETLEAAAAGCVVFSNQDNVKNYLKSSISIMSPEQFISKILVLLNDEIGLYKKSIETSKEVFSFGEDFFIEKYGKVFEQIILKNKGYIFT